MLFIFIIISFAGSTLVSSYARQFTVMAPILAVWLAIMIDMYLPVLKIHN